MIQPAEKHHGLRPVHAAGVIVAFALLIVVAFAVLSFIAGVVWTILKIVVIAAIVFLLARFLLRRSRG
jgi:hypothetical protein